MIQNFVVHGKFSSQTQKTYFPGLRKFLAAKVAGESLVRLAVRRLQMVFEEGGGGE